MKRYNCVTQGIPYDSYGDMEQDEDGDYVLFSDAQAKSLADERRIKELEDALIEIYGSFDAAIYEGLMEKLEGEDAEVGSLTDLVRRRLLPSADVARTALRVGDAK